MKAAKFKTSFFLLVLCGVLSTSCNRTDCCAETTLSGRFEHQISDCDTGSDPEINCTDWLDFIDDSKVSVLYGGGDIVFQFTYQIKEGVLSLQQDPLSSFAIHFDFEVIDAQTLRRRDNGDLWKRKQ